jgi:hypothetical protein
MSDFRSVPRDELMYPASTMYTHTDKCRGMLLREAMTVFASALAFPNTGTHAEARLLGLMIPCSQSPTRCSLGQFDRL